MADEKRGIPPSDQPSTLPPPYPGNQQMAQPYPAYGQPQPQGGPYLQGNPACPTQGYTANVVTVQPYPQTVAVVTGPRPTNWMVPSILACIFCCWPIGIFAIIAASNANTAADRGDTVAANNKAKTARNLTIAAVICGIIIIVVTTAVRISLINKTYRKNYYT